MPRAAGARAASSEDQRPVHGAAPAGGCRARAAGNHGCQLVLASGPCGTGEREDGHHEREQDRLLAPRGRERWCGALTSPNSSRCASHSMYRREHHAGDGDTRAPAAANCRLVLRPRALNAPSSAMNSPVKPLVVAGRSRRGQDGEEHRVHRQQLGEAAVGRDVARVAALVDHATMVNSRRRPGRAHHLNDRALDTTRSSSAGEHHVAQWLMDE